MGMVIEERVMVRLLMDLMVAMMGWWRRGDLMEPCLLLLVLLLLLLRLRLRLRLRLGMRCYMVAMLLLAGTVVLGQVVAVAMMLGVPVVVVVVWCGIVSGGGNRRRVVTGAKWTVRIGDVVRRHDLDDFWTLRSRCWTQKRPQIADLGLELVHGWLFFSPLLLSLLLLMLLLPCPAPKQNKKRSSRLDANGDGNWGEKERQQ